MPASSVPGKSRLSVTPVSPYVLKVRYVDKDGGFMRLFLAMLTGRRNLYQPSLQKHTYLGEIRTDHKFPQSDKMLEYTELYRLHYLNYT